MAHDRKRGLETGRLETTPGVRTALGTGSRQPPETGKPGVEAAQGRERSLDAESLWTTSG